MIRGPVPQQKERCPAGVSGGAVWRWSMKESGDLEETALAGPSQTAATNM
jgi:hypothetical protein